jgi:HPt (histidine-containing phosphotransfer) domain-containing protein
MARVTGMGDERPSSAVNFAFLEGYASGDETLVREVLTVFRAEAAEWSGKLSNGASDWRFVVHTMKGTSRAIGADGLGELCRQAEDDGGASLPRVRAALDDVVGEIAAYLAKRS